MNGISIYYTAKTRSDSDLKAMVPDIQHGLPDRAHRQAGAWRAELSGVIYNYCKYPSAATAFCASSWSVSSAPRQRTSIGFISHTLRAYDSNPVWTDDPADVLSRPPRGARHAGYAGRLGKRSAAVLADFIIVDMFGEVCIGEQTPKEAAHAPRNARAALSKLGTLINVIPAEAGIQEGLIALVALPGTSGRLRG